MEVSFELFHPGIVSPIFWLLAEKVPDRRQRLVLGLLQGALEAAPSRGAP